MATAQEDFTTRVPSRISERGEEARVGRLLVFQIEGKDGGTWTVDLRDDLGVRTGDVSEPDCTLRMDAMTWEEVAEDPKAALKLYLDQRITVEGDISAALQIQEILG